MSSAFELYRNTKRLLEDLDNGRIQEAQDHLGTERLLQTLRDLSEELRTPYQFESPPQVGELPPPSSSWGNVVYPLANLLWLKHSVAVTVVKQYVSHSLRHEDLIEATKVSPNEVWDFYQNLVTTRIACVTNLLRLRSKLGMLVRGLLGEREREFVRKSTEELVRWIDINIDEEAYRHLHEGLADTLRLEIPHYLPNELLNAYIDNCLKKQALLLEAVTQYNATKSKTVGCKVMISYLSKGYLNTKVRSVELTPRALFFSRRADNAVALMFIEYLQFNRFDQIERELAKPRPDREFVKTLLTSPSSPGSPKNYKAMQNVIVLISRKFNEPMDAEEQKFCGMIYLAWAVFLDRWSVHIQGEELFPAQEIEGVRDYSLRACDYAAQVGAFQRLDDLLTQSKCGIIDQQSESLEMRKTRGLVQGLLQSFFKSRLMAKLWPIAEQRGERTIYYKLFCESTRGVRGDLIAMQKGVQWDEARKRFPIDFSLVRMLTSMLSVGDAAVVQLVLGTLRECKFFTVPKSTRIGRVTRNKDRVQSLATTIVVNDFEIAAGTIVYNVVVSGGEVFGRCFDIRYSALPFLMDKLDSISRLRPKQQHESIVKTHLDQAAAVLDFLRELFSVPGANTYSTLKVYLDDAALDTRQNLPRHTSVAGLLVKTVRSLSLLVDGTKSYVGEVYELLKTTLLIIEKLLIQNRHTREICRELIAYESHHGEAFVSVLERIFRDVEIHSGRFDCTLSSLRIIQFLIRTRISNIFVNRGDAHAFTLRLLQLPHEIFGQYDSLQYVESKHRSELAHLSLKCFSASLRSNESLLPDAPNSVRKTVFEHFVTRKSLLSQLLKAIYLGSECLNGLQFSTHFAECAEVEAMVASALDLLNDLLRSRCIVFEQTDASIASEHSSLNASHSTSLHGALVVLPHSSPGGAIVPYSDTSHNTSMSSSMNRSTLEAAGSATDPRAFEKALLYFQEETTEKVQFLSVLVALSSYEPHHNFYRSTLPQRVFKCLRLLTINSVSRTSGASLYSLQMFFSKVGLRVLFFSAMRCLQLFSTQEAGIEVLTWIQESLRSQPTIADYLITSGKRKTDGSLVSLQLVFYEVFSALSGSDFEVMKKLTFTWAPFYAQVCSLFRQMWMGSNSAALVFIKELAKQQEGGIRNLVCQSIQFRIHDIPRKLAGSHHPDPIRCTTLVEWMGLSSATRNLLDLLSFVWQQEDGEKDHPFLFADVLNPPNTGLERWLMRFIGDVLDFSTYERSPGLNKLASKHGLSFDHCFTAQCESDPVVDIARNHIDLEDARIFAEAQRSPDGQESQNGSLDGDHNMDAHNISMSSYTLPKQNEDLIGDSVCDKLIGAAEADVWKRYSAEAREGVLSAVAEFLELFVDKHPEKMGFVTGEDDMLMNFPAEYIDLLIEKMQHMLDVLPEDSALLHAGMSRCLGMSELFLKKLVDAPDYIHPSLQYNIVCRWLESFVRLLQNPKFMPISLTAKRPNDERHELYDLVMERVSRTYTNVGVILEAVSKSHSYAVADGSVSAITNSELTTFFHCGEVLKSLCSHMQHRRVVILAPELINILLQSGLMSKQIITALEASNAFDYFFSPILRPKEGDTVELNASLEFLANLAQNDEHVAQALVTHGVVTALCNSPVFVNAQISGAPHTADGERNPWHVAWLSALRLVSALLRSKSFNHAFYFITMFKVRLLGRLTLPDTRSGGHLSKAELEEILAIVTILTTMFQRDTLWASKNPELHTATLHVVTHLFEGCVKLAVHPRALKKRVWPITKAEKLSSGVSLGVRFDETTAFGTMTHGGVFAEGHNQYGLGTAEFGDGFDTESLETHEHAQPRQPGLLSSVGIVARTPPRRASGGADLLATPTPHFSALSRARDSDDAELKHDTVKPLGGYPTPGAPSPITERRRPASPLPRPESPLVGMHAHDASATRDKNAFWNDCEALLNLIIADCLRCLRVPMERVEALKGCDYNHKQSIFSPDTPANFWKLVDPTPVGTQPSWVILSQCAMFALKTIRNIQREYDVKNAANAKRLLFIFDHCFVILIDQLGHFIGTKNTFEFMSPRSRTRLLDAVSKFDGLFRDFMKDDRQRLPPIASENRDFYKLKEKEWQKVIMSEKGLKKHDANARLARTTGRVDLYG